MKQAQADDGSFPSLSTIPPSDGAMTALAYYTMRRCGVGRDDPSTSRAWHSLQRFRRVPASMSIQTDGAAFLLMAIESHAERLVTPTDDREMKLSAEDAIWVREIVDWLVAGQAGDGNWDLMAPLEPNQPGLAHEDTQFALLGLKCAARCGVLVDPLVWKKALIYIVEAQDREGPDVRRGAGGTPPEARTKDAPIASAIDRARGWNYRRFVNDHRQSSATAALAANGVSSVVLCRSELLARGAMPWTLDVESERSVRDGLAFLGRSATFSECSANSMRALYSYFGVLRAGMNAGVEWMAETDWYGAGAQRILEAQREDGGWTGEPVAKSSDPIDALDRAAAVEATSYAILFLKKGIAPVRRGGVPEVGSDTDFEFRDASKLTGDDIDFFLGLVLVRWRHAAEPDVKRRLFEGATSAGPKIVEPLLIRMESSDADVRVAAHSLLRHATGLDFGYVAGAAPESRETAVTKWQAWWMDAKDKLAYDAASKRLVVK